MTGGDVITDDQVEVINKDLIIATMTDDVPLSIELTVENGRGYVPASEQFDKMPEVGVIPLDAAFSPITRVRYKVEDTRVGQRTNYDKLTLEIWTNGTVGPDMALVEAAKILRKHLNPFINLPRAGSGTAAGSGAQAGWLEATGYSPVDLELEEKLGHASGRTEPLGPGHQLPGIRRDQHGPRPRHPESKTSCCRSATSAKRRCWKSENGCRRSACGWA